MEQLYFSSRIKISRVNSREKESVSLSFVKRQTFLGDGREDSIGDDGISPGNDLSPRTPTRAILSLEQDGTRKRNLHGRNKSRKFSNGT